jgi:uncharacterized protein
MIVEWDKLKEKTNIKKHGISFKEAQRVFDDPLHLSMIDIVIGSDEERWVTIGFIKNKFVSVVAHTYYELSGKESIRIISARKATKKEINAYENVSI